MMTAMSFMHSARPERERRRDPSTGPLCWGSDTEWEFTGKRPPGRRRETGGVQEEPGGSLQANGRQAAAGKPEECRTSLEGVYRQNTPAGKTEECRTSLEGV